MATWGTKHYEESARKTIELLKKYVEEGISSLPTPGSYNRYVIYKPKNCSYLIEIPQEVLNEIKPILEKMPIAYELREYEVGYNFYESGFICIKGIKEKKSVEIETEEGEKVKFLETLKKIKEEKIDLTEFVKRGLDCNCIIDEFFIEKTLKRVKQFKKYLLKTKKIAKKINKAQKKIKKDYSPVKFVVKISLDCFYTRVYIKKESETIVINLETSKSPKAINNLDNKLFEHWYKIIKKTGELNDNEHIIIEENYKFFIYTINQLIKFLDKTKKYLKRNLKILHTEIAEIC